MGAGVVNEITRSVAGPASRNVPFFTGLVVVAVAGHSVRPVVTRSLHGISSGRLWIAVRLRTGAPLLTTVIPVRWL